MATHAESTGPFDGTGSPRVRPYTLTGGRTQGRHQLPVDTIVSVAGYDPALSETLMPESRALYEQAREDVSIADLSELLAIPLGVVRVLVSDLTARGALVVQPPHTYRHDQRMLERILDGLTKFPT